MNKFLFLPELSIDWSFAIILVIVGLVVVLSALAVLVLIIANIPATGDFFRRLWNAEKKTKVVPGDDRRIPAQVSAAIAAAIHLYLDEIHDKESRIVTIRKVSRTYSPWSSKIYGLNILKK